MSWVLVVTEDIGNCEEADLDPAGAIGPFETEAEAEGYARLLEWGEKFDFTAFELEAPKLARHTD